MFVVRVAGFVVMLLVCYEVRELRLENVFLFKVVRCDFQIRCGDLSLQEIFNVMNRQNLFKLILFFFIWCDF